MGVFKSTDGPTIRGVFWRQYSRSRYCMVYKGEYHWQDGRKYIGQWKDNERYGRGEFIWSTGIRFIGEYKYNLKESKSKLFFGSENSIEESCVNKILVAKYISIAWSSIFIFHKRQKDFQCIFWQWRSYKIDVVRQVDVRGKPTETSSSGHLFSFFIVHFIGLYFCKSLTNFASYTRVQITCFEKSSV